ncbi:hypothetical protein CCACVL1_21393 [Corchorus capsularis]|uniref:Uncharacterized protein n=1 Tax=Corchorus capsularis TaxID=210143 RepID=A0A1R3H627_COCAP|nr:hypothetical protein CCACVL1_21393 [Corchorus capsularis]
MASPKSKLFLFAFYMALTSPSMEAARPLHQSTDPNPNFEPSIAEGDFYSDPNRSFPTAPGVAGYGGAYGPVNGVINRYYIPSDYYNYGGTFGTSASNYGRGSYAGVADYGGAIAP